MKPYYDHAGITIFHGDCREILPTLPSVDLVLTDPPYGISYVHGAERHAHASKFNGIPIHGDDSPFDPAFLLNVGKARILWGGNHYADKLPVSRGWLVWDKRCGTVVNDQSDCEIAWTDAITTARLYHHVWDGFRRGTEMGTKRRHPTEKPVALMTWCLGFFEGSMIDPFMGSGPSIRAAKDLGRKAIGIEIEEKYCEIAAKRLSQEVFDFKETA